jgi:hypothetical protein
MKFEVCQECFVLSRVYVMKPPYIPQNSLHKHGTITQITPDIPQTSLHKHGTAQNTADTPVYVMKLEVCQE